MPKPCGDSGAQPRALFLSPEPPLPPIGGGALRSASLLAWLTRHFCVDVVAFRQPGEAEPAIALAAAAPNRVLAIDLPAHSKTGPARLARNFTRLIRNRPPLLDRFSGFEDQIARFVAGQSYQLAVIEHFWCAPYAAALRPAAAAIWLDLHNIESEWHASLAAVDAGARAFAHRRFAALYRALEQRWIPAFDRILVTSPHDARQLGAVAAAREIVAYPNAIPAVATQRTRNEQDVLAFSGNLEYEPNRAAVRFFRAAIWPALRERFPQLVWRVIGKNPHAVRRMLEGDARIHLTGPVPDAMAALAEAKVAVVPLLSGSGTRVKILEAWGAATPVVSTAIGAEGLECVPGVHLMIADQPAAFAESVAALLSSADLRRSMGLAGQALCRERYTWEAAWRVLEP